MANHRFEAQVSSQTEKIDCQLSIFSFIEGNTVIFYSPAFDLSGYGNTQDEARESFKIAFDEFIQYTLNKKTFFSVLKKLGWVVQKKKKLKSPPLNKMLDKNEYLADIFENKDFSKFNQPVSLPAYA